MLYNRDKSDESIEFTIDGVKVSCPPGVTILAAAEEAGIYIPYLCTQRGLTPHGSCRVCTVMVNGRSVAACTTPVTPGIVVENETEKLKKYRRQLVEMLFAEGNHYCMFCEVSGNCELQAMGYRLGMTSVNFPYLWPKREVDASHPDVLLDLNRCILCGRCVTASRDIDGKNVFQFLDRSINKHLGVNAKSGLGDTELDVDDRAASVCPVGAIIKKGKGFSVPVGERLYDHKPIGWEIESKNKEVPPCQNPK